uniref:Methyltransferase type 11 n=1 Tax=Magnetococcus massalia (strain MO-1) TaxID=451514 RepID=A0A1S7LHA6_MAGMO|nr:Methyltransferase type 11 [Candidatus Magnetococcus massalia]
MDKSLFGKAASSSFSISMDAASPLPAERGNNMPLPHSTPQPIPQPLPRSRESRTAQQATPGIPSYLQETYWWAYVHPNAVRFFERQWLVNLILWGNFIRLRDAALAEMKPQLSGNSLQVACVYGDFTQRIVADLPQEGQLDVVDIAPEQLKNLTRKLGDKPDNVALHLQDSSSLQFADNSYDTVLLFFLLHEQPEEVRAATVKEAFRVCKPGGKVIFVDYHLPVKSNPFRYLMRPVLQWLEPFAMALWEKEIRHWFPAEHQPVLISKETYFGGLYQKVVCEL